MYHDRGECENWIAAVKQQLHAGTTLVDDFWANDVLWSLGVLAYNVLIWMRWLADPAGSWHEEPQTFRAWYILVAGKLVSHARQYQLHLAAAYVHRARWTQVTQALRQVQLE